MLLSWQHSPNGVLAPRWLQLPTLGRRRASPRAGLMAAAVAQFGQQGPKFASMLTRLAWSSRQSNLIAGVIYAWVVVIAMLPLNLELLVLSLLILTVVVAVYFGGTASKRRSLHPRVSFSCNTEYRPSRFFGFGWRWH